MSSYKKLMKFRFDEGVLYTNCRIQYITAYTSSMQYETEMQCLS